MNNNQKATKRALLTSVMALVMCVVMLVGTTFAWFTDSASTAVNKIQAGTLDVALEMKDASGDWVNAEGQTLSFVKAAGAPANEQILWEPGCTYELPAVKVVNKGNLALKYKVIISAASGDMALANVLDVKLNGQFTGNTLADALFTTDSDGFAHGEIGANSETAELKIALHMQESAGNEYQGLSIDGIGITVVATQDTVEYDSTDNTYDENADYTIQVNKDNIQDYLDGKYGSINGMTLVLAEGNYGTLKLGRATKYPGSNTQYRIGSFDAEPMTFDVFYATKNGSAWTGTPCYIRSMNNVTFKAADGANVKVAGVYSSSGHIYQDAYDYVLDRDVVTGTNTYYLANRLTNITFDGIEFTAKSDINTSIEQAIINGFTFKNCTFNINNIASGNQALRYYNENNNGNVRNLVVDHCSFNTCYQGVYTQKINGVTVINSSFNTTGHNAIAVQSGSDAVNHKAVVITGNTFANIGDRIIRFGSVGADTQITIKNNTATASGDSSGEVMKAQSLAEGVTYNISSNNWGEGKTVGNNELKDR